MTNRADSSCAKAFKVCLTGHICVEVFCGKGRLSRFLRQRNFQVFCVDHKSCKGTPVLQLDITVVSQRRILEELLAQDAVLYVHFAPPCGTASEARSIALSSSHHGPPPLRSLAKPMGLDNLTRHQQERVKTANFLYEWTCDMIRALHCRGVGWSVENPAGSLMWVTVPFVQLQAAISSFLAFSFHACMFQAERKKDAAIWTSVPELRLALERKCDNQHAHKPWGLVGPNQFATAEECAYNVELSRTWAQAIADYAQRFNIVPEPQTFDEVRAHSSKAPKINQAMLGLLRSVDSTSLGGAITILPFIHLK